MAETPMKPGYYWAKWKIAAEGTHEGDELTPSNQWEIVQVNENCSDPSSDEYLTVSISGVREVQWPKDFFWGSFIAPIAGYDGECPSVVRECA